MSSWTQSLESGPQQPWMSPIATIRLKVVSPVWASRKARAHRGLRCNNSVRIRLLGQGFDRSPIGTNRVGVQFEPCPQVRDAQAITTLLAREEPISLGAGSTVGRLI